MKPIACCVLLSVLMFYARFSAAELPATTVLPTEYFTRHDQSGTVKISPDGKHVAFTTGKYGRSVVVFLDLTSQKVVSGVRCPEGTQIEDFYWVSPTRLIYSIAERWPGYVAPVPTGEIMGIDVTGRNHKVLYGFRAGEQLTGSRLQNRKDDYATAEYIARLKTDDQHILIAEHRWRLMGNYWRQNPDAKPELTRLNVYSGKKSSVAVAPLRRARVLLDQNENVRFAVGLNDSYRSAVSWKPQADAPWTEFSLTGFRAESVIPHRFSADNSTVLLSGVREGERYAALYRLTLQTQKLERVDGFDDADVRGVVADFAGREVVGFWGYRDRRVYKWIDEADPAARLHLSLQRAFAAQDVSVTSLSDDGRLAIVFAHSDTNPGEYFLFDTVARKADVLRYSREWVRPHQMRPKQPISLPARDGVQLHGYLTTPVGTAPHPLIVLPHGGPHGRRDYWEYDPEVQLLAHRGYAVLQVNFRGSGGYGMDFEAMGYRQWGAAMQDDVTDATRWAIDQKITTADRICIYGASYGAFAALMGVAREPDLYRCAVGFAGVYDLELMFTAGDLTDFNTGRAYLEEVLGTDASDLRKRSPAHNAGAIKAPVLLIHGKQDWRADYDQATRMKSALEKNGKAVEWLVLGREGHGIYDEESRKEVYERVLAFLNKHLPTTSSAEPMSTRQ